MPSNNQRNNELEFTPTFGTLHRFEYGINKSITNIYDALWMCFTTLSTVGYGDMYPVTAEGRLISVVLVVMGAGFFALLSGEFAAILLKYSRDTENKNLKEDGGNSET